MLAGIRSRITRATDVSSDEHLNPIVNNITDQGLSIVQPKDDPVHKDHSQITFQSLKIGDIFDKDIKRIMTIINGVEKTFSERRISKNFQDALQTAF